MIYVESPKVNNIFPAQIRWNLILNKQLSDLQGIDCDALKAESLINLRKAETATLSHGRGSCGDHFSITDLFSSKSTQFSIQI